MVLAVINNKRGTGKTTSPVILGAALALKGRRAPMINLDAQASASLPLEVDRLVEAPSFGKTIFQYEGQSYSTDAYRQLADKIIQRK